MRRQWNKGRLVHFVEPNEVIERTKIISDKELLTNPSFAKSDDVNHAMRRVLVEMMSIVEEEDGKDV